MGVGVEVLSENEGWWDADGLDCEREDSEEDSCFEVSEEIGSKLSGMSLDPSGGLRYRGNADSGSEQMTPEENPQLNEKETECFDRVEKMIKGGRVDELKIDECKLYLRKYALRLSGNKSVLQARIKEHLEVSEGGGLNKYPVSSFVLNCRGDACTGDVVMFEQQGAVPRTVAGRIVKESYGAAKQQHTFTIEVLWSRGVKPLPALHPLLIKGRNLYRLKTTRQVWGDEEERRKVLREKHGRGDAARCSRDSRIREKEMRVAARIRAKERWSSSSCILQEKRERAPLNQAGTEVLENQRRFNHNHHLLHRPELRSHGGGRLVRPSEEHDAMQRSLKPLGTQPEHRHHFRADHQGGRTILDSLSSSSSSSSSSILVGPPRGAPRSSNSPSRRDPLPQRPMCRFHLQGRCRYGDSCKYQHAENGMRGGLCSYR
ncbi:unnamed protein product [Spirodela intermedia]|uniref:C3H1-type domain-containing protein n=1 Tax=Spirodela intermedia TaxID=51605 RepID=A0A7I8KTT8_SPIIN|nr:unnamed protein product [Spirodela intermedia]